MSGDENRAFVADVAILGFTADQVQRILSLIEESKDSHEKLTGKNSWLLDRGASLYMTGSFDMLEDVDDVVSIQVNLVNGEKAVETKQGCVMLSPNLRLQNVLFVPTLKCN